MAFAVRAITLDLDDTVWPFAPIGARIERVLDDWMRRHSPATAEMFPVEAMRALRERVATEHPSLGHDMSALRRLTLEAALRESGGDVALAEAAYEAFFAERNRVECYPDAIDALERISARLPGAAHAEPVVELRPPWGTTGTPWAAAYRSVASTSCRVRARTTVNSCPSSACAWGKASTA